MRKIAVILFCATIAGFPAFAQNVQILGQRPADAVFTIDGLTAELRGMTVEFYDGSRARYGADGAYAYTYQPGDDPFEGKWSVRSSGEVCVTFNNGFSRCDHYVRNGDRLVLIVANGDRFPVRIRTAAK